MLNYLPLVGCALAATDKISIDPAERIFRDSEGRQLIFHGVNVVYKVAPFIPSNGEFTPDTSLDAEDIADLQSWGMNLVRLGVMWEAVESSPGVYNDAYLDEVEDLINRLGEKGIYTLVDAHQDVLARIMCGEGMPNFYAKEIIAGGTYCVGKTFDKFMQPIFKALGTCKSMEDYGFRKDADGNPVIEDCQKYNFADFYSSPESQTVFRAIYNNDFGMQDKYVAYWTHVANRFSSNPYVIGYDPLNEPAPAFTNPLEAIQRAVPGVFDHVGLQPLFDRVY